MSGHNATQLKLGDYISINTVDAETGESTWYNATVIEHCGDGEDEGDDFNVLYDGSSADSVVMYGLDIKQDEYKINYCAIPEALGSKEEFEDALRSLQRVSLYLFLVSLHSALQDYRSVVSNLAFFPSICRLKR